MERLEGCRGTKPLFVVNSGPLRRVKLAGGVTSLSEFAASFLRKNFMLCRVGEDFRIRRRKASSRSMMVCRWGREDCKRWEVSSYRKMYTQLSTPGRPKSHLRIKNDCGTMLYSNTNHQSVELPPSIGFSATNQSTIFPPQVSDENLSIPVAVNLVELR
jgi:hypothetical protein